MASIFARSTFASLVSLAGTLAICLTLVPMMGGSLDGIGLLMAIICPVAVSFPSAAILFAQGDRLRRAERLSQQRQMELERAYDMVWTRSRTDWLTGVLNRGTFLSELEETARRGGTGGLLYIDLDHFKRINDIHGHATGDAALALAAQTLVAEAGAAGKVGRLGGEEFAVFFEGLPADALAERAGAVCRAIANTELTSSIGRSIPLSASIGAVWCRRSFDVDQMLQIADAKMYAAKQQGRSRVVAA